MDARDDPVAVRDREVRSDRQAQKRDASRLGHRERSAGQTQAGKRAGHVRRFGIVDLGRDPLRGQMLREPLAVRMADAEQVVDAFHAGLGHRRKRQLRHFGKLAAIRLGVTPTTLVPVLEHS